MFSLRRPLLPLDTPSRTLSPAPSEALPSVPLRGVRIPHRGAAFLLLPLLFLLGGCGGGDAAPEADPGAGSPPPEGAAPETEYVELDEVGYDEGDVAEAPVRIIEFSDFGCVFCARFHMESYAALHDEFVATGDVAWKYVPITVGGFPNGTEAALAAECVGEQGNFAVIRDRLYEERTAWLEAAPDRAMELFRGLAAEAGADLERWESCLEGEDARARLEASNQAAMQVGVQGTPTFVIQDFVVQGAPALADFQGFLRDLVGELRGEGSTGGAGADDA